MRLEAAEAGQCQPMTSTDRKPGRPRNASVDAAIIQAALEMLDEVGLQAVSMDGVAARAGVGKATIYRRWDSREDLLIDAVAGLGGLSGSSGDRRHKDRSRHALWCVCAPSCPR